jgi:hypothetical protein
MRYRLLRTPCVFAGGRDFPWREIRAPHAAHHRNAGE